MPIISGLTLTLALCTYNARTVFQGGRFPLTRGCVPASNTFADVFTSARLRWRGIVLTSIKECVGPSGVTHRFAREDESEADVDRERVRLWSQTARTVLIWAQSLATVFSNRSFGSPSIDCFASAMNVGPKTLITSQYLRTKFEADLQTITKLATHLELDDANFCRLLRQHQIHRSKLWNAFALRVDTESLFITSDGRLALSYARSIESSDSIALIAGSDFSLILRKRQDAKAPEYIFLSSAVMSLPSGSMRDYEQHWKSNEEGRPFLERIRRPILPGQPEREAKFRNFLVSNNVEQHGVVSGLMRCHEWPEHAAIEEMTEIVIA